MAASHLDIVKALRLSPEGLGTERVLNFERFGLTDTVAITRLIAPAVKDMGFDLVRVAMIGGTSDPTLQVMAERPDTRQLTIDDCSDLSRKLSELLDAEEAAGRDPIEGSYRLEVSSPGIDRPLTRDKDFANWAGHEVRIVMDKAFAGQRVNKGVLGGIEDGMVLVKEVKAGDVRLPRNEIHTAKLVLTDALIAATRPLDTSGADELIEDTEKADD